MKPSGFMTTASKRYKHSSADIAASVVQISLSADTYLVSDVPTANLDTVTYLAVGETSLGVSTSRVLIKPDFTGVTFSAFTEATLYLVMTNVGGCANARTLYAHRCLRAYVSNQATWNIYSTGNNWGTAGCSNSTNDYHGAVEMGSVGLPASPTLYDVVEMPLNAAEFQKLYDGTYTNNGIVLFVNTQLDDRINYGSKEEATPAYRPRIVITGY